MHPQGENFEDYKNQCARDLAALQPEFMKCYDIDSYGEWFYDHGIGAFHFKAEDGRNLYFKYVDVGSFSTKTNTWNWGWANKTTPVHVSRPLEKVRLFGEAKGFENLTSGLLDGDDYTGWEMTAISAKLLSAIGAYRVPLDHLFIYFIFTNQLTQDEYDALKDKYIDCSTHIASRAAFVCQHLNKDTYTGFHEAFESDPLIPEEDEHQAWCDKCEKERLQEGEWNERSMAFANIKVICDECYFEIKANNQPG